MTHDYPALLTARARATNELRDSPYNPRTWIKRAELHEALHYPDLATGDYYKALLLSDEIIDDSGEYHDLATGSLSDEDTDALHAAVFSINLQCNTGLARCLTRLGCLRSAWEYCANTTGQDGGLPKSREAQLIWEACESRGMVNTADLGSSPFKKDMRDDGMAARELYPWNKHEPDRYSEESLASLNRQLAKTGSTCVVKAVELPTLGRTLSTKPKRDDGAEKISEVSIMNRQLGLFATKDLAPGEIVLNERSMLTANNRLHDPLCDACSSEMPSDPALAYPCPNCEDSVNTIFCSRECRDLAQESYHLAVCGNDGFETIGKDQPDSRDLNDSLYGLLVGRAIAMAETQEVHPLDLNEVRFLWGDYTSVPDFPNLSGETEDIKAFYECKLAERPKTLPFSFEHNVKIPLHLLQTLDVDIFVEQKYDLWVINTMLAKFRGVASARPNSRGRPEVAAVHPLWCLANHSCAPNVRWEWGGKIRMWVRDGSKGEVVRWGDNKDDSGDSQERWRGGIMGGEEILNHYTDVKLGVKDRREWAAGALGGKCMCDRCQYESRERRDVEMLAS